jgi:hypothetical protein
LDHYCEKSNWLKDIEDAAANGRIEGSTEERLRWWCIRLCDELTRQEKLILQTGDWIGDEFPCLPCRASERPANVVEIRLP